MEKRNSLVDEDDDQIGEDLHDNRKRLVDDEYLLYEEKILKTIGNNGDFIKEDYTRRIKGRVLLMKMRI